MGSSLTLEQEMEAGGNNSVMSDYNALSFGIF